MSKYELCYDTNKMTPELEALSDRVLKLDKLGICLCCIVWTLAILTMLITVLMLFRVIEVNNYEYLPNVMMTLSVLSILANIIVPTVFVIKIYNAKREFETKYDAHILEVEESRERCRDYTL